jgi:hypothetical protein
MLENLMHIIFCEKCYFLTPIIWPTGELMFAEQQVSGTQLYKGDKPVGPKMTGMTYTIDGKTISGIPVRCPRGHINYILDTPEQIAEAKRLQFNFGKLCVYHDKDNIVCDQRMPCKNCIVYQNRLITEDNKCLPIM